MTGSPTTDHDRSRTLDTLRALAALMVLCSHARNLLGGAPGRVVAPTIGVLAGGVWIFFAVSGFLIAGPFVRALMRGTPLPPIRRYATRRAARIFPAYWLALAAILIGTHGTSVAHWWQVPIHALLLHAVVPGELQTVYFVAWTLSIELLFYALVPLGALLVRRVHPGPLTSTRLAGGILALWAAGTAVTILLALTFASRGPRPLPPAAQLLDLAGPLSCFCPGILVFILTERSGDGRRVVRRLSNPCLSLPVVVALFFLEASFNFRASLLEYELSHPVLGVASGLLLITALRASAWLQPVARRLAPLGLISYGIYLWHWVVLQIVLMHHGRLMAGTGAAAVTVAIGALLLLTLPLAAASWLLVERPLIRRTTGWERPGTATARTPLIPLGGTGLEEAPHLPRTG